MRAWKNDQTDRVGMPRWRAGGRSTTANTNAPRPLPPGGVARAEALEARVLLAIDPSPAEQHMMELLNRMRMFPAAELGLLTSSLSDPARSSDPDVDSALRFFETSGTELARQWASLRTAAPLAWNEDLYEAAEFHNNRMIQADEQTHQAPGEPGLGDRARNAGYRNFTALGESVYAFARGVLHSHAGFALDWGNGPGGIQSPAGHRDSMMSPGFREVGIRITGESDPGTEVGPLVVTQDFGARFDQGNPYLLGVVFADGGAAGYGAGEGLGGVTVQIVGSGSTYLATSMSAGGYQVQVPAGVYDVTFSGAGFGGAVTYRNVSVGGQNVKVDAARGVAPPRAEIAVLSGEGGEGAIEIASGDTSTDRADGTDFGLVNLAQTLTRAFTVVNTGQASLRLGGGGGAERVRLTGQGVGAFTVVFDPQSLVRPGESTTFYIRFVPPSTRLQSVIVTIRNDDPDEGEYRFRIKGRGELAPDPVVSGRTGVAIRRGDDSPSNQDGTGFGSVNVVSGLSGRDFTITNEGSSVLTLERFGPRVGFVRVFGVNDGEFRVITPPAETLQPGQSTTFRVRFNPSGTGPRVATVRLRSNDPDGRFYEFDVRGVGVLKPIVQVWWRDERVEGGAFPSEITGTQFGAAAVGGGRVLRTFTITNVGSAPLEFSGSASGRARLEGSGGLDFEIVRQPGRTVGVGRSATFRVRFDPDVLGARLAVVVIDTLNAGSFSFNVAGTGV